jgi:hypothetical protein
VERGDDPAALVVEEPPELVMTLAPDDARLGWLETEGGEAVEEARRAWRDWKDAWTGVLRAMRSAGISTARIDAYRVGTGYDEGGGQSFEGWLDEIEADLTEGDPR